MEFRFPCFVIRHASQRVTVLPLDLPRFNVHAPSVEKATEDLNLALEDQLSRLHPRHLADLPRLRPTDVITLQPEVLPVWTPEGRTVQPLPFTALRQPAHASYVEVRIPRLDLRLWFRDGDDVVARATEMLRSILTREDDTALLALRKEGREELFTLSVQATPTQLSALEFKHLLLDERPPPRPPDAEPEEELAEEEEEEKDDDTFDDDVPPPPGKKRKRPATPTLAKLGDALHVLAKEGALERAFCVESVVEELQRRVEQKKLEPVVLVGPAGVGKTAIIHALAQRLVDPAQPESRRERPFFHVDASRLIAGQGYFGDWQQQTYRAMEEARRAGAIVHFGHVMELLDAGKSAHSDQNAAQILAPLLSAQKVAVLGEATPEEWARVERTNQAFASTWAVLRVDEPPTESARTIVTEVGRTLAQRRGLELSSEAVDASLALTRRFWPYGSRVGNTVTFLRRLIASRAHAGARDVSRSDAIQLFSSESGIPLVLLRDDVPLPPTEVRAFLGSRVMGQVAAVDRVTEVVSVIKAGLMDDKRPMAVLFFSGPTGVGKTELSKALAEFIFGSRDRMVRLDMGEYAGPDALSRLIGDFDAPGHLTAAVRRQPFSLVLLDEIEKANPAVFDTMLGLLGEGRLTDAQGRFTDFRNAIIIMTSNLGAENVRSRVGFSGERNVEQDAAELRRHYRSEAERFFRPELFNRIDDFVVFMPLQAPQLRTIVRREVDALSRREGFRRHSITLETSDAALEHLLHAGLDPRYGARPLKRAIEQELVVPIGAHLSSHPGTRQTRLSVDVRDGAVSLDGEHAPAGQDAGAVRSLVHDVLDEAAELRSRVRRLRRGHLATGLRHRLAYFDKASREKSFWADGQLAEQQSARAAVSREILEALMDLERQTEATEDLAFEAFYDRSLADAEHLHKELLTLGSRLQPLAERLYAMMFPPRGCLQLYLTAGRGAWHQVVYLTDSYAAWCSRRGLDARFYVLGEPEPGKKEKKDAEAGPRWEPTRPSTEGPLPLAACIAVTGEPIKTLLAAEHGVHRFADGSQTQVVKVRVDFASHNTVAFLKKPSEFLESMPSDEIRRISLLKRVVKDFRTNSEHEMESDLLPLETLLSAWMDHRLNHVEAEPWN